MSGPSRARRWSTTSRAQTVSWVKAIEGSALGGHLGGRVEYAGHHSPKARFAGEGVIDGRNGVVIKNVDTDSVEKALTSAIEAKASLAQWQEESWKLRDQRTWSRYRANVASMSFPL